MNNRLRAFRPKRPFRGQRTLRGWRRTLSEPQPPLTIHASDAAGVTAAAPAAAAPAITTSIATLLSRHVLRDGEIVLLALKPSLWSIFFNSLPSLAVAGIVMLSTGLGSPRHLHIGVESGSMLIACWTACAILNWSARLYLLTDLRVVRISGIFNPQIHDIPLRKIARTRLVSTTRERLWRLGSIEIIPESEQWPCSVWQTIPHPQKIHETVRRAIARAKQGGCFSDL